MYGLQKGSELKEIFVKMDKDTAVRYRVIEERIDLRDLQREKSGLEGELALPEPTTEELAEVGKMIHPYHTKDADAIDARLDAIDAILDLPIGG